MIKLIAVLLSFGFVLTGCPKIEVPNILDGYGHSWRKVDNGFVSEITECRGQKCDFKVKTSTSEWTFTNYDKRPVNYHFNRICRYRNQDNFKVDCKWVGNRELYRYI